jgi:tetratricopeptide (TPR) repeat protein
MAPQAAAATKAVIPTESQREAAVAKAEAALAGIDQERLVADRDYAGEMLAHIDTLRAVRSEPDALFALDALRLIALLGAVRNADAAELGARLIAQRPSEPMVYPFALWAAVLAGKSDAAVPMLESAARHMTRPEQLDELRSGLVRDLLGGIIRPLGQAGNQRAMQRMAEALLTVGPPLFDDAVEVDGYRVLSIDGRLAAGNVAGARELADRVIDVRAMLRLIGARRYDPLFAGDADRLARLETAVAAYDADTKKRLEKADDLRARLFRGQFLRGLAREQESLAVLLPATSNLAAVEAGGEDAFWIVNEAAYALTSLGRNAEAIALMERLIALEMKKHPYLINMAINHSELLNIAGRHKEAAAYGTRLLEEAKGFESAYGRMWIWSAVACGHALAGDPAAAAPWLAKLEQGSIDNQAAHMRALLCANRLDRAEQLMLARLAGKDAEPALRLMHDYRLGSFKSPARRMIQERGLAVGGRPAVRAAAAKVGRTLSLPLSQVFWGDY